MFEERDLAGDREISSPVSARDLVDGNAAIWSAENPAQ